MLMLRSAPYNCVLKGGDEPTCHLGGSFSKDRDNTLLWNCKKCVTRLAETCRQVTGGDLPKRAPSQPMDPDLDTELDDSPLCASADVTRFQRLLGALQWMTSLCRFDIAGSVLCSNLYNLCPRKNHLKWIKQIAAYACHTKSCGIRHRTFVLDYSHHTVKQFDWAQSFHKGAAEPIPLDAPIPLGKLVQTTTGKTQIQCTTWSTAGPAPA